MSKPDYSQIAEDHASLLVLVRPIGTNIKPKIFNKLFERISQLNFFNVPKPHRNVRFKYKSSYTKNDCSWGSFQAHRKVLGLITIGKCSEVQNSNNESYDDHDQETSPRKSQISESKSDLITLHRQTTELFEDTLLDSILIILDSNYVSDRESTINTPDGELKSVAKTNGGTNIKLQPDGSCYFTSGDNEIIENGPKITKMSNGDMSASHVWFFNGETDCETLDDKMQDFFNSLFWVLESKRMDRSQERNDNINLLMAPPEKDQALPVDVESRSYKKKCLGRYKKHLGDLSLLAGIPGEASLHYQTCLDTLKTTNDWLWIAGAQEGLAVASYLILKPKSSRPSTLNFTRNVSFSGKRLPTRNRDASLAATLHAAASSTLQSGLDLANNRVTTSVTTEILHEDILTNYKEAIVNYSKIKDSCIIEMEASLKACRILAMYRRVIDASDFLQNVVKINAQLSDEEKVEQFTTLATLYAHLGLKRKSAFYGRVAAMVCVAPSSKKESWPLCYSLLLQSLPGFKLSLDYRDMIEPSGLPIGWPSVKLRVMHELIYSRRRLGDPAASIRHVSLLLHSMFDHLTPTERLELCSILQSYSSKNNSTPSSMALEDGTILPPVPLTRIPQFVSLKVLELPPALSLGRFKRKKSGQENSTTDVKLSHPFIYSPFINSHLEDKANDKNKEVTWVEGNTANVTLNFKNTLTTSLQVDNLELLVEGSKVEVHPVTFTLAPSVDNMEVVVEITPSTAEEFCIVGYTWEVFGVKSIIRFKELQQILMKQKGILPSEALISNDLEEKYSIKVKPQLPLLHTTLSSTLMSPEILEDHGLDQPPASTRSLVIYAGQSHIFKVILSNREMIAIDRIDLIKSSQNFGEDALDSLIECLNGDILNEGNKLPLHHGSELELKFKVEGLADFIIRKVSKDVKPTGKFMVRDSLQRKENLLKCLKKNIGPGGTLRADLRLQFQYNGGDDKESCRESIINIPLFILPCISILQWNIVPGKSSEHVNVALELKNCTELMIEISMESQSSEVVCIEPSQVVWVAFEMRRMTNDFMKTQSDPSLDGFNLLDVRSEDYRDQLIKHLQKCANITWKMPVSNTDGRLPLDDIPFSKEECATIQIPLITWDVTMNGKLLDELLVVELQAFQCSQLIIHFKNQTDFDFHDFNVSLVVGDVDDDAVGEEPNSIIFIGSSQSAQILMKSGDIISHHFSLLTTGCTTGYLNLTCSASSHTKSPEDYSLIHSSSTPSTVLLHSSSTMTLTCSSSTEQVAHRFTAMSVECNPTYQKLENETDFVGNSPSETDVLPEIEINSEESSKKSKDLNSRDDESSDVEADRTSEMSRFCTTSTNKTSFSTCATKEATDEKLSNLSCDCLKVLHKWSFVLDVKSKVLRDDDNDVRVGGDDNDVRVGDGDDNDVRVGDDDNDVKASDNPDVEFSKL